MTKIEFIRKTFEIIDKITDGNFVTMRNFDDIPDNSTLKNDIDVMVPRQYIPPIAEKLNPMGYNVIQDQLQYMYGAEPHIHFESKDMDIHFDMVTGLYYRSSNDLNLFINISDVLTNSMFVNKVKVDDIWMYQASPEDEIVHLCCHSVFDKRKTKPKYSQRINELFENSNKNKVKELLDLSFYMVSDTIYDAIVKKDTSDLYKTYISYSNY